MFVEAVTRLCHHLLITPMKMLLFFVFVSSLALPQSRHHHFYRHYFKSYVYFLCIYVSFIYKLFYLVYFHTPTFYLSYDYMKTGHFLMYIN